MWEFIAKREVWEFAGASITLLGALFLLIKLVLASKAPAASIPNELVAALTKHLPSIDLSLKEIARTNRSAMRKLGETHKDVIEVAESLDAARKLQRQIARKILGKEKA
jgi:hypothetical protein